MQLAKKISQISMILVLLTPLVVYSGVQFSFSIPRWVWLLGTVSVFFVASLAAGHGSDKWKITKIDLVYSALILLMCASLFVTTDIRQTLWSSAARTTGLVLYVLGFLWFVGARMQNFSAEAWRRYFLIVVGVAGFASMWGIFDMFVLKDAGMVAGQGRLSIPAGNALIFATYLAPILFIAAFLFAERAKANFAKWQYILVGVGSVFIAVAVGLTYSRSSYIGVVAGVLIGLIGYGTTILRSNNRVASRRLVAAALIIFLGTGSFYTYAVQANLGGGRLKITSDSFLTLRTRFINWKIAFRSIQEHPVVGVGWENYRSAVDRLFDPSLSTYSYYETRIDKPHNVILEVWATLGTVGLLVYLALIYATILAAWRLFMQKKITLLGFWSLIGFVVAYHVQNLFAFDSPQTIFTQTLVLVFLSSQDDSVREASVRFFPKIRTGLVIICALLLGSLFVYGGFAPLRTMRYINRGLVAAQARDFDVVHSSMKKAFAGVQGPYYFETWRWFAESLLKNYASGQQKLSDLSPEQRVRWEEDVLQIAHLTEKYGNENPDSFEWQTFAGKVSYFLAIAKNDVEYLAQAKKYFLRAFEISKVRQEPPILLSYVYALEGNNAAATEWYTTAVKLSATIETASALDWLVNRFANEKDVANAILVLENTVESAPNATDYARLAAAYADASRFDDATKAVHKAVELDSTFAEEAEKFISGFTKK
jgi:O-antigen ligase/tetratricopeptide (TPR) repeat protein